METALFSPSSLFAGSDGNSTDEEITDASQNFVERRHQFPGMELLIREFDFHELNANLLWPGTFAFTEWLVEHRSWLEGRRILELGSGTGALAIFLQKSFKLDITTSDYDDADIEENIAHNCQANGISPALPHIKHTWGDAFPTPDPYWDLIIASDILLYVKQYPNLIKTLSHLLRAYTPKVNEADSRDFEQKGLSTLPQPAFLMSWRRRIGKEDESLFFDGCEKAGLKVNHLGSRVYCIKLKETEKMPPKGPKKSSRAEGAPSKKRKTTESSTIEDVANPQTAIVPAPPPEVPPPVNKEPAEAPPEDAELVLCQQVRHTMDVSPSFINKLSVSHEIGYQIDTARKDLPLVIIPLDVAELRRCFAATLRSSLLVAYLNLGSMRQASIDAELDAFVPAAVDVCMSALYSKLRYIHRVYNVHPTRYPNSPSYSKELELPLPFSLAIQELGVFETHSETQRRLYIPTFPQGTQHEGRENADYRVTTYMSYLPTLKELNIPLKTINPSLKIGSPWWTLQTRVAHKTVDLVCTLPPSLYTDFSPQLRMLFIVADEDDPHAVKDIVSFPDDVAFYGICAKELPLGINCRSFLALSHCPEEWWSFK